MIIRVSKDEEPEIVEPHDLKRFHIAAIGFDGPSEDFTNRLGSFSTPEGPDHAWVSVATLKCWAPMTADDTFDDCIERLVEIAKEYGFFNETRNAIRAHIEFDGHGG